MIEVQFDQGDQCQKLYEYLLIHNQSVMTIEKIQDRTIILRPQRNEMCLSSFQSFVSTMIAKYIVEEKENEWIKEIAKTIFLYSNEVEIQQILTMTEAIIRREHSYLRHFNEILNERTYVYEHFFYHLNEKQVLYFEPFIKFRLRRYYEWLTECVAFAIEEYILEQEYQQMIATYRDYLKKHCSNYEKIHVVYSEGYLLFTDEFVLLKEEDIAKQLDHSILFEEGVKVSDMILTPLVSLRPQKVMMYTDREGEGVVQSLKMIFEERLFIFSLENLKSKWEHT